MKALLEQTQTKKEDISKPTTRSKMKNLVSKVLERLKKIKGQQTSMYKKISYVQ